MTEGKVKNWLPLESNPDVMNKFVHNLGVPEDWNYYDVYGLDDELLMMVPQPVAAVLMLFPVTDEYEAYRHSEEQTVRAAGQTVSPSVYFTRQTIPNACGTVGIIHSIANTQCIPLGDGSLSKFLAATSSMSPDERAAALEEDETIGEAHHESAQEGQTEAPDADEDVNLHFVCFTVVDGCLYELDGRKPFPINHGAASTDSILSDVAVVVRKFIERTPDNLNFTLVALCGQ